MMDELTLGERIADLRETNGLSQSAVARVIGVKPSTISSYENGRIKPRPDKLEKLAELFGASPEYLSGKKNAARDLGNKLNELYVKDGKHVYRLSDLVDMLSDMDEAKRRDIVKIIETVQLRRHNAPTTIVMYGDTLNIYISQ